MSGSEPAVTSLQAQVGGVEERHGSEVSRGLGLLSHGDQAALDRDAVGARGREERDLRGRGGIGDVKDVDGAIVGVDRERPIRLGVVRDDLRRTRVETSAAVGAEHTQAETSLLRMWGHGGGSRETMGDGGEDKGAQTCGREQGQAARWRRHADRLVVVGEQSQSRGVPAMNKHANG